MADLYFDIKPKAEENKVSECDNLLLVPEKEKNDSSVTLLKAIITALKLDLDKNFRLIWVPESGYSAGRTRETSWLHAARLHLLSLQGRR